MFKYFIKAVPFLLIQIRKTVVHLTKTKLTILF